MEPYPYGNFPDAQDNQYQASASYYNQVPPANPYQVYPGHVTHPGAQVGDPRQWSQTPGRQVAHPTHFPGPNMPVSAYSAAPIVPQWPSMRPDVEVDGSRERIRRTRTACEECRKRKQRCDGNHPCQPCTEQRTQCQYRDVQPSRKETSLEKMIQLAEGQNSNLASMSNSLDSMTATLGRIDRRLESESSARAGFQAGPQGALYPTYPQYGSPQGSMRPSQRGDRGDGSAAGPSKRRRH